MRFPFPGCSRWEMLWWGALAIALVLLCSCGTRSDTEADKKTDTQAKERTVTKEVIRETPLENGGKVIERTLVTDVVSDESSKSASRERTDTGLDAETTGMANALGRVAGAAVGAATGTPGLPWAEGITALASAAALGWGALKSGQNGGLKQQVEFHKSDAEEGWRKAMAAPAERV